MIVCLVFYSQGTPQLPVYQSVLLSISGDSKISLQHTSVQQLSTIPEGKELVNNGTANPKKSITLDDQESVAQPPIHPILIDDDQFDEPHVLIQDPAPDGGYGWVIVFASFMCNLIVDGIAYTFGLFFGIFTIHFATSKSKVALCGALLNGCYLGAGLHFVAILVECSFLKILKNFSGLFFFPGPIVSSLANKYGCRFVTILGATLSCIALILSTAAPNIETLMITYGIVGKFFFFLSLR